MSPVSPVKGLSLKNYVPPKSPSTTPPSSSSALPSPPHSPITISRSSSPSPSPAPPALGLGNLDFNNTQTSHPFPSSPGSNDITPQPNNSVAFPSLGSPVGSPGTNASYEALVKQWCFGGSPGSVAGGHGHGKSASEPAGAGGWLGMSQRMGVGMVGVGEMA
ncbi:hypothetical protein EXIGLDRAFT_769929 [Exidia glandulosa HHB12029]|uniref:Uncharacterized protein n=1 Tax=Exidia glandulosa HHB12029 TaxID=1314781 RepID=A0A166AFD8_EXIGL|nr:hypothetical protein EXIGLDRAFT_769929 [Exidia glandulosa HHB12029]